MLRKRWNRDYLNKFCSENEIKFEPIQANIKINRDTLITGPCTNYSICGKKFEKIFRYIVENGGAFCDSCIEKNKKIKTINTNMSLYNVSCSLLHDGVIKKCKETNLIKFGHENAASSKIVKEKMIKTNIEKRGVSYPAQDKKVYDKMTETTKKRLGVKHNSQSDLIKKKKENTNLKNRGVKHPLQDHTVLEKISKTTEKRLGVKHNSQSDLIKKKKENTNLKNRGVKHPLQDPKVASKSLKGSYRTKEYECKSGKIIYYQGYENFALDELNTLYQENDIINGKENVPEIWYTDLNGKKHRYFPDILIKSIIKCVEVKSPWTFKQDKNIFIKQQAVKDAGFYCEIWIYDCKGNKVECHV